MTDSSKDSTPDMALKVQQALIARGVENPVMKKDTTASTTTTDEGSDKIQIIKESMTKILQTIGMDLTDDSIEKTPLRIAKMFIEEVFSGLNYANFPEVTTIDNKMEYTEMIRINDIALTSTCEHHFVTFDGTATLAYIPKNKILGLSKFNRLVRFFAQRPQVQERLTQQVLTALQTILETDDVAVYVCATHFCVKARGVMDQGSSTATLALGGVFKTDKDKKKEFLHGVSCKI